MSEPGYFPSRAPGDRDCLRCGKKFKSVDVTGNRICNKCSDVLYRERGPKAYRCTRDNQSSE
jgi:DNA-directed RNA polymerase subunit RPC12/RpoP